MSRSFLIMFFAFAIIISCYSVSDSEFWYLHQYTRQSGQQFEQRTDKFWEFEHQSNSWIELRQPFDLVSCLNGNCSRVCSIDQRMNSQTEESMEEVAVSEPRKKREHRAGTDFLPFRKRVSVTKMSDASVWITGPSGSIYERFWNGLLWVIAQHDLPVAGGRAVAVFVVNQTILALEESWNLYQLQLRENLQQPEWVEFKPVFDQSTSIEAEQNFLSQVTSGVTSDDREKLYFCTKDHLLIELIEIEQPRCINHGRPPGANVKAIVDASSARSDTIFTVSSAGDLYEFDKSSKPAWKKHIQKEGSGEDVSLAPIKGCSFHGLNGATSVSVSLFLLTREGSLVERKFQQRKWKWTAHGSPSDHALTAITCVSPGGLNENVNTMLLTSEDGCIFEYRIPKQSGISQDDQFLGQWVNHGHPPHAKVAKRISGLQLQHGRYIFPLDDGRLSELHLPGTGGDSSAPNHPINPRRKVSLKYVWSIIEAPESEGWNAEYCTEKNGPTNCLLGTKDGYSEEEEVKRMSSRTRMRNNVQETYLSPPGATGSNSNMVSEYDASDKWITKNFRMRVMQEGKSFFLITDDGQTFEYLSDDNVWFWLRHQHSTDIKGVVGNYNGSLFLVDENGSVLIRGRINKELAWINCTAMRKGRQIVGGPPWDSYPGKARKVTENDALYFVSRTGNLLQLTVALKKYKWKDCKNPPNTKIACIADQEMLRENIVFVIGRDGRLYQYNRVTELWHEHYQSKHLVLSKLPGTAMRLTTRSLKGSLFMVLENGRLIEYHWDAADGWNWVEHGIPSGHVTLVGSPGPCLEGGRLFLVGSDGNVYLRYLDHEESWTWRNFGFPYDGSNADEEGEQNLEERRNEDLDKSFMVLEEAVDKICDPKVDSTRPITFGKASVIFELRDGRLAELQKTEEDNWVWSRTIATPTSLCVANYIWAPLAS